MSEVDGLIRRGPSDYAEAFAALLPTGPAWSRDRDTALMQFVAGLSAVWAERVDARAADLLERESDPRATLEMLREWERAFGLPDPCVAEPLGIAARRQALVAKMTTQGGQSRAFFIGVAAALGYTITIIERSPWMFGLSQFGDTRDPMTGWPDQEFGEPEIRFNWIVKVGAVRLTWWRFGEAQFGIDPHLRIALATDLECLLRRWKPAQTSLTFSYAAV